VQRALRTYRAGFYEQLRAELASHGIGLLLFHSTLAADRDARDDRLDLPWAQHLPRRVLRLGGRHLVWQPLTDDLRSADLVIVEQASQLLLNYRLLLRQALGGPPVAFWGHGRSFAASPGSPAERLKAWLSRRARWWFAYTSVSADVVRRMGVEPTRLTVVNNAIDTAALRRDLAQVSDEELSGLRGRFGVGDGVVGLFLGTLRDDKRLDVLLDASRLVRQQRDDFHLFVVGSGPVEGDLRAAADRLPWVHVMGPQYGRDRAAFLRLADVLLIPGWVGLVVLDSLVAATPLITSADSDHAPEIAYLRDGVNGRIVTDGGDPARYAEAVLAVLDQPALLRDLAAGCLADADRYSIEQMVERFVEGIRQALDLGRTPSRGPRGPLSMLDSRRHRGWPAGSSRGSAGR
jgi:L-malate glycosyltransferase